MRLIGAEGGDAAPWGDFLACPTPQAWVEQALVHLDVLLLDHRHNEFKAAASAMALMARYPLRASMAQSMSRLAREELVHHQQVSKLIAARGIPLRVLSAGRYAGALHRQIRREEPGRLIDTLVVAAFIELRSCERFAALLPVLDAELAQFYGSLLASERRHHQIYLKLAADEVDAEELQAVVARFREMEGDLINSADPLFRFHSGVPPHSR